MLYTAHGFHIVVVKECDEYCRATMVSDERTEMVPQTSANPVWLPRMPSQLLTIILLKFNKNYFVQLCTTVCNAVEITYSVVIPNRNPFPLQNYTTFSHPLVCYWKKVQIPWDISLSACPSWTAEFVSIFFSVKACSFWLFIQPLCKCRPSR